MAKGPVQRRRRRRRFHWSTFAIGLGVTAAFLALFTRFPGLLTTLELKASDARVFTRGHHPSSNLVAIVAIDDKSIREIGRWPWSRAVFANLQRAFIDYKVKVVAYDVLFTERDPMDVERQAIAARLRSSKLSAEQIEASVGTSYDQQFADAIKAHGNTLLPYSFAPRAVGAPPREMEPGYTPELQRPSPLSWNTHASHGFVPDLLSTNGYRPPIPVLNGAARETGFVDVDPDIDGLYRNEFTVVRLVSQTRRSDGVFMEKTCVPMFIATISAFENDPREPFFNHPDLFVDASGVTGEVVGKQAIPVDEIGRMLVTFQGPSGTVPHYSAADVLNHRLSPDVLAGKIVLVGVTGTGLGDRAATPAGYEFPRVEIHANAVETVLTGDFVSRTKADTLVVERFSAVILGIAVSIVTAILTPVSSVVAILALAATYFGYAQFQLVERGVILGVVLPFAVTGGTSIVLLGYRYVTEGREKGHLRHVFEHYLHPDVIASVVDHPGGLKLGGERRHVAVLFADIIGFTSRAEKSDAAEMVALLNVYMTKMTNIILESGGIVDKLMGDGIMAFWGAPNEIHNASRSAIDTALKMRAALGDLQKHDTRFDDFEIGIGINTGDAIVGNFGGEKRFDYSVIGDTVNFASRLEGLTRRFGVHLLVSKKTYIEAGDSYVARDIGMVKVKGKEERVAIMEIVGRGDDGVDPTYCKQFAEIVEMIHSGDSSQALQQLEQMKAGHPDDVVLGMYLAKLKESAGTPPREMVFEFDTK